MRFGAQGRLLRQVLAGWKGARDGVQPEYDALRHQDGRQDLVSLSFERVVGRLLKLE